ncbi:hypothetical protein DXG01_011253 [Tephrocybe rancida]|nr:hypothetical protein DXG01_011253 [Tephrocybe rancida]
MATIDLSIPKTARAAVLSGFNEKYAIRDDYPVTQPSELQPGECLVKIEYSGVCHSDLHIMKGDWQKKSILPLIGGHEAVGRVVAIGEHSDAGTVKIGDRVGLKWIADAVLPVSPEHTVSLSMEPSPNTRYALSSNRFESCLTIKQVSYINYVTPIPDALDSAAATPFLCAGMTVYKALKQSGAKVGNWVSISGAGGGLGHLDTGEAKKELVFKLGAEKWVDFKESTDLTKDVHAATDGLGPHAAIIAAGDARPFNQALLYLRMTGTLVAVGMPAGSALLNVHVPLLIGRSLTVLGSAIGNRQDISEALQIAAQGKVKCQYQVRELNELNEIFDEMESGAIAGRVLLKF